MAEARIETKEVEVTEVRKQETVVLEMTNEEARAVYEVLMNVGGVPDKSPRGLCDNVRRALGDTLPAGTFSCVSPFELTAGGYTSSLIWKNYNKIDW